MHCLQEARIKNVCVVGAGSDAIVFARSWLTISNFQLQSLRPLFFIVFHKHSNSLFQ